MRQLLTSALVLGFSSLFAQSYNGPESVDYDIYGKRYLVSNSNLGQILSYDAINNELDIFASGVGFGPHGLEVVGEELFACSGSRLKAYNLVTEEQTVNVNLGASFANGITHKGNDIFITDFNGKDIYRYNLTSGEFNMYIENLEIDSISVTPNGIFYDDIENRLLVVCWGNNAPIIEINMLDSSYSVVANTNLGNCDGISMDNNGDFYVSAWSNNAISKFNNDFSGNSTLVIPDMNSPADIYYNRTTDTLAIPNSGDHTVVFVSFGASINSYMCVDEGCVELSSADGDYATLEDCEAICQTTRIDEKEIPTSLLYPNPVMNGETITVKPTEMVVLYTLQGQKVFEKELNNNFSFNLPFLKNGFYLVKTSQELGKILIQ
tara:strand:- start:742 stop:1878 length:1137 start_codon:yes stop_codon:yes gene_type:complete